MVCRLGVTFLCLASAVACHREPPPQEYKVHGQVLAVRTSRRNLILRHGDIEHFMPAMTMPYRVKDRRWLEAAAPGRHRRRDACGAGRRRVAVARDAHGTRASRCRPTSPRRTVMEPPLEPGGAVPDASFIDQDGRALQVASLAAGPGH